jgi:hypothetical protein
MVSSPKFLYRANARELATPCWPSKGSMIYLGALRGIICPRWPTNSCERFRACLSHAGDQFKLIPPFRKATGSFRAGGFPSLLWVRPSDLLIFGWRIELRQGRPQPTRKRKVEGAAY